MTSEPSIRALCDSRAAGIHPIVELLCLCSGPEFDQPRARRAQELVGEFDPDLLSEAAIEHHRVPSVVTDRLRTLEGTPATLLETLQTRSRQLSLQNLGATQELLDLLTVFEETDIPAVPFKGPVLAAQVYGDLGARQFSDLDVMIPADRIDTARTTVIQAGFEPVSEFTPRERTAQRRCGNHVRFRREDVSVELHWQLSPARLAVPIDYDWMVSRRDEITLAGQSVPTLAPEPLLVALCIHGSKHCWKRLKWICDIGMLVRSSTLDWERVETEAERIGRTRQLYLGVLLAAELVDAPVPDELLTTARESGIVRRLRNRVLSMSLLPTGDDWGPIRRLQFQYRSLDHARDRQAFLRRFLFQPQPADVRALPLPVSLLSTVRPIRLAALLVTRPFREQDTQ